MYAYARLHVNACIIQRGSSRARMRVIFYEGTCTCTLSSMKLEQSRQECHSHQVDSRVLAPADVYNIVLMIEAFHIMW